MSFCERERESDVASSNEDLGPGTSDSPAEEQERTYVWNMSQELKELAFKELGETDKVRNTALAEMRSYVMGRDHLRHCCRRDNPFLLRFLRSQKFNVSKACAILEKYLDMKVDHPKWFQNLDPSDKSLAELADSGFLLVLPDRDQSGRRVIVNYVTGFDANRGYTNSDVMRLFMCILETLLEDEENQIRGISYIFYCKDINLSHLSIWSPPEVSLLIGTCEKNLPVRHRDINLVSLPFSVWFAVEFVKQFINWKIKRRIHTIGDDKKLRQKFDPLTLPPECGGDNADSLAKMGRRWRERMMDGKSALLALEDMALACQKKKKDLAQSNTAEGGSSIWSYIPGMSS